MVDGVCTRVDDRYRIMLVKAEAYANCSLTELIIVSLYTSLMLSSLCSCLFSLLGDRVHPTGGHRHASGGGAPTRRRRKSLLALPLLLERTPPHYRVPTVSFRCNVCCEQHCMRGTFKCTCIQAVEFISLSFIGWTIIIAVSYVRVVPAVRDDRWQHNRPAFSEVWSRQTHYVVDYVSHWRQHLCAFI